MKNEKKNTGTKATAFGKLRTLAALTVMMLLSLPFYGMAQETIQDADGKAVVTTATEDVTGSSDYKLDWADGSLTRKDGKEYANLKLKYDAYDDLVIFQNSKGSPVTPVFADVTSFTIKGISDNKTDLVFANGFPAVDTQTPASYYIVLSNGKTKLLKHVWKNIRETQGIGDGTVVKSFADDKAYYIFKNGAMTKVKPDEKEITAALSDKAPQLTAYAKTNKLGFKSDEDLGKIFDYYNTL